jgi:hypothetical protein
VRNPQHHPASDSKNQKKKSFFGNDFFILCVLEHKLEIDEKQNDSHYDRSSIHMVLYHPSLLRERLKKGMDGYAKF